MPAEEALSLDDAVKEVQVIDDRSSLAGEPDVKTDKPERRPAKAAAPPVDEDEDPDLPGQEEDDDDVDDASDGEDIDDDDDEIETDDDTPAIDPPSSWTRAEKEAFAELPPEAQRTLFARERERDLNIRRTQNEAATLRQQAEQVQAQAQEVIQYYNEQALPRLMETISSYGNEKFADIQTENDLLRMSREDPARYQEWKVTVDSYQRAAAAKQAADAERSRIQKTSLEKYRNEENEKFLNLSPEFGDPEKAPLLYQQVQTAFNDYGITDDELSGLFSGDGMISVHDHRAQLLIRDAARWRAAKSKAKVARRTTPDQVQRPGTAPPSGRTRRSEHVSSLDKRLTKTGNRRDAIALVAARIGEK